MPGNDPKEAATVGRELRSSKESEPCAFAFGTAKKASDGILLVDDSKKPGTLVTQALRRSDGRVFSGSVYCKGAKAIFASDDAPSNGARLLNEWLKFHKIGASATVTKDLAGVGEDEEEEASKIYANDMLIRRFRQARRAPVQFAFGPVKDPSQSLLALHPRREGRMLFRALRKENGAKRGSWGTVKLEGRVASFTVTNKPIPELRKRIRSFLRHRELRFRVMIVEPGAPDAAGDVSGE